MALLMPNELLAVGTRVRHIRHDLAGRIIGYEWCKAGEISALPYRVQWDDDVRARKLLGVWRIWPAASSIAAVSKEALGDEP